MLDLGVIKASKSSLSAPAILVSKKRWGNKILSGLQKMKCCDQKWPRMDDLTFQVFLLVSVLLYMLGWSLSLINHLHLFWSIIVRMVLTGQSWLCGENEDPDFPQLTSLSMYLKSGELQTSDTWSWSCWSYPSSSCSRAAQSSLSLKPGMLKKMKSSIT